MGSLDNFPVEWAYPLAVVKLPAEIDAEQAGQVRDTLLAILNRDISLLVIDMTQTSFCSVAGASGAEILLAVPAPIVRRVLAIAGIDRQLRVFTSLAAALAAAGERAR